MMNKKNIWLAIVAVAVVGVMLWAYRANTGRIPPNTPTPAVIRDYQEEKAKREDTFCKEYPRLCDDTYNDADARFEAWCAELPEACARCKADPKSVSCIKG